MKILISTGGTGGHILPAVETAKVLRDRGHKVSFAGTLGSSEQKVKELGYPVYALAARGLDETSFRSRLSWTATMAQAVCRSFGVIRKCNPDKIIGFGGYGAFPVAMAGSLLRRRVLIHEQNVVPGRANALLAGMVSKVAISFEASRKFIDPAKAVWTGCPCRYKSLPSRAQGLAAFGLDAGKKTLVLIGGSQGSQRMNEVFFEMMKELSPGDFQAVHLTGPREFPLYDELYRQKNLPVKAFGFINNVAEAYAAADIVVARAGAATVTELGLLGLAAILVPYPYARGHQRYNAAVLAGTGAALVIEQKDLDCSTLKEAVGRMISLDFSREGILQRTKGVFQTDAALQLALVTEGL